MNTELIKYVYIVTNDDHDQNMTKIGSKLGPVIFEKKITVILTLL